MLIIHIFSRYILIKMLNFSAPSLATWGAGAGSALLLLGSDVPLMKKDILSKIPVVGSYWAIPTAESE
jgi:hypothetical protein